MPCCFEDDRSELSSQAGSAGPPFDLVQAPASPEIDFAIHGKSDGSSKEDIKTQLNPKLSVNGASKSCCPVKRLTTERTISRFGKENQILKSLPSVSKTRKTAESRPPSAGTTTAVDYSERKTTDSVISRAFGSTVYSPGDQSISQPVFQSPNQKINLEEVQTEKSAISIRATADFEDEVNLFEAGNRQRLEHSVCSVRKSRRKISCRSSKLGTVGKKRCNRIQQLDGTRFIRLKLPLNAMDKSSPTRYTNKPSFRGGVIDSSDDSVSGPLENLRWQKSPESATKHRRHHNQRTPDAKGHRPVDKVQSFSWNPTLQRNEMVNLKGEPNISDNSNQSSRSGRTKVMKRHFGNVQKTSPIMEWNGDLEDSDDQFSHPKEFQQYMVMCQLELMKEFKNLKLSLSRQIVNLQLDVDKILANHKAPPSEVFQGLPPHRPGSVTSVAEGQILELVDQNQELAAYSSLKLKQELIKSSSPSSEESYNVPAFKFDSQCDEERKRTHFDSWPQEESHHPMTSHRSCAPPAQSHVFRNLQNNPIYHVQTSSDKRGGSSDSDISISSSELTHLNYREAMSGLLETLPESDARQCLKQEQPDTVGVSNKSSCSPSVPGPQRKKSNGTALSERSGTYGKLAEIGETAVLVGNQSQDLSYRDTNLDTNGHTCSQHVRSGRLDEQGRNSNSEDTLAQMLQSGSLKAHRKDDASMLNLLGTYTAKARTSQIDVSKPPAAEPLLGIDGRNPSRPTEKKSRSARPLFAEEPGKTSWKNPSTTSPTSTYEPPNQQTWNRKGGAEQGRFTYSGEEPQNHQYRKAITEERQPTYTREEYQGQHYDNAVAVHGLPPYLRAELQSQQDGKPDAQQDSTYSTEETENQQSGWAEAEQRPPQARELHSTRLYGQLPEELGRTRRQNSVIEKQGDGEQFTLRGWAAAFLEPPTEITTQKITLQTGSPKTDFHSSDQDSPTEQALVQEPSERERHREKENGNQYAVRQFAGKSSKGGCAWTVSEPSSPHNSQKGSPANGTPTTKGRQKHQYKANNP